MKQNYLAIKIFERGVYEGRNLIFFTFLILLEIYRHVCNWSPVNTPQTVQIWENYYCIVKESMTGSGKEPNEQITKGINLLLYYLFFTVDTIAAGNSCFWCLLIKDISYDQNVIVFYSS